MDYELAKELKDAGFPQEGNGIWTTEPSGEGIYIPTLSELIEACGDGFRMLEHLVASKKFICFIGNSSKYVDGSTPEEAVARLRLALHKKS